MENDRFTQNRKIFTICMISLLLSLSLFAFAFYILPNLLWDWNYDVPEIIFTWRMWFVNSYGFSERRAKGIIFLIFFIPALITGMISYFTSNQIENEILGVVKEKAVEENVVVTDFKETLMFILKLIAVVLLVIICVFLIEWLLTVPPPPKELI